MFQTGYKPQPPLWESWTQPTPPQWFCSSCVSHHCSIGWTNDPGATLLMSFPGTTPTWVTKPWHQNHVTGRFFDECLENASIVTCWYQIRYAMCTTRWPAAQASTIPTCSPASEESPAEERKTSVKCSPPADPETLIAGSSMVRHALLPPGCDSLLSRSWVLGHWCGNSTALQKSIYRGCHWSRWSRWY